MQFKGIKRGNRIELLQEVDLPEGVEIIFEVKTQMVLSLSERLERLRTLFGAWENQPDLDEVFAEIDENCHQYYSKPVN